MPYFYIMKFKIAIVSLILIVSLNAIPAHQISHPSLFHPEGNSINEKTIRIALYDSISPSVNQMEEALNYAWDGQSAYYKMTVERIDSPEVMAGKLNPDNYDILFVGASGRQYFQGITERWKGAIKNFISSGGGYVGICGGANIVSMGIEHPRYFLDRVINKAVLGIVPVYLNDDQDEEWQYLWKDTGRDHIPVKVSIKKDSIIFSGYGNESIYITYGGGAGMYPAGKNLTPIAFFEEEPMEVAPLHYYRWNGEIVANVTTDIEGQVAGIEASYGNGKIIIFSPHPEIPPMMNGSTREFFGFSIYGIPRYVYEWKGGEQTDLDYNWWILRRSAAVVAGIPEEDLPPVRR